ncbi:hypothetical protein AB0I51_19125 [Streptomyces sp. NPDC050549]|uniref:hypothetical protein n=1 Tax=Streptomyces sp. NPDC050549 TaxID=3155406 RepID=UPI00344AA8DA
MDRLSEITFLLPNTLGSRSFLDDLRSMFVEVAYADFTAGGADSRAVAKSFDLA